VAAEREMKEYNTTPGINQPPYTWKREEFKERRSWDDKSGRRSDYPERSLWMMRPLRKLLRLLNQF